MIANTAPKTAAQLFTCRDTLPYSGVRYGDSNVVALDKLKTVYRVWYELIYSRSSPHSL